MTAPLRHRISAAIDCYVADGTVTGTIVTTTHLIAKLPRPCREKEFLR